MPTVELLMPKMGESIIEATVLSWLKEEGDTIEIDEPVLEIATDKVDSEVPSEVAGVLKKKLYGEGDVVKVGEPVAIMETEGGEDVESPDPAPAAEPAAQPTAEEEVDAEMASIEAQVGAMNDGGGTNGTISSKSNGRFYSPLVRTIASSENISQGELDALEGSGQGGRVTKHDILAYVEEKKSGAVAAPDRPAPQPSPQPSEPASAGLQADVEPVRPATDHGPNVEVVEMDRMRKLIAKHMIDSKRTSAHVTSMVEADLTNVVMWRDRIKKSYQEREGEKITFTPIFIEAVAKALKDFPMVNVSVEGDNLLVKKNINVGMATALPSGNLIVPVVKNADQLNLMGLSKRVNDLAARARSGKLTPDEIEGGTYTLTNVGTFGNVMGTPIINQPQVGILSVGIIKKKPVVIETEAGDTIGIRHMMYLSHTYDHRVVDGALGGQFVRRVADYLENFDVNRTI